MSNYYNLKPLPDLSQTKIQCRNLKNLFLFIHFCSSSTSRHPSVSRDNGKTSLLGVETQRDAPGRKDRKVKSRRESILPKNKYEKLLKIL